MNPPKLRTILLFPPHVYPNPTTLPLLTALQSLLNVSYNATYCTRPDIFGTSHLRLTDPARFAEFIGTDGFTVAVFAVKTSVGESSTETSYEDRGDAVREGEVLEIVATGSVEAVGDEDIRKHAQWESPAAQEKNSRNDADSNSILTASEELNAKLEALYHQRQNPPLIHDLIHELRAFAVSPTHQGVGLGAYVLKTIEWLLGSDGAEVLEFARGPDAPSGLGVHLSSSLQTETGGQVHGIDLDEAKNAVDQRKKADVAGPKAGLSEKDATHGAKTSLSRLRHRKLVMVAIRELGNEVYYQRRGFKSLRTSILPVGTWGSNAECTTVYMEKDL